MLMFIDKAFTIILLLCALLILPVSLLVTLSAGRTIVDVFFKDTEKKVNILNKFFFVILIILVTVLGVTLFCSLIYLIYRMALVFISDKIIFFNI